MGCDDTKGKREYIFGFSGILHEWNECRSVFVLPKLGKIDALSMLCRANDHEGDGGEETLTTTTMTTRQAADNMKYATLLYFLFLSLFQ